MLQTSVHVCNGWILQCAAWSIIDSTKFMRGMNSNCQIREICTSAYMLSNSIHQPANDFQTCKPNRAMTSERAVSFMRTVAWHVNVVNESETERSVVINWRSTSCVSTQWREFLQFVTKNEHMWGRDQWCSRDRKLRDRDRDLVKISGRDRDRDSVAILEFKKWGAKKKVGGPT